MKGSINKYIDRIKKLADKNTELNNILSLVIDKLGDVQKENNNYLSLLSEFSLNLEEQKEYKDKNIHHFNKASILFLSIEGFDKISSNDISLYTIDKLDEFKVYINKIAKKYNLIKVQNLGDMYIFGAGIKSENNTNPIDIILAALEMRNIFNEITKEDNIWSLNIGIHTGSILAEETGNKNVPYRIAGNTINFTTRLGKSCMGNKINISAMTYELVKEFFTFEQSGTIPVKYRGIMDTYYINDLKNIYKGKQDEFTNKAFTIRYAHTQFNDIQEEILNMMEHKLPKNLPYHNIKHTIDVITEVELIGWAENVNVEEMLILKLAALFHDTGYTISYKNHEENGCIIARNKLKKLNYPSDIISKIEQLIMATKIGHKPKCLLEKIICDSDLDYLGRSDFIPVSDMLYQELRAHNLIDSYDEWNELQLKFISNHQYYTETAKKLRAVNKSKQIKRLETILSLEKAV